MQATAIPEVNAAPPILTAVVPPPRRESFAARVGKLALLLGLLGLFVGAIEGVAVGTILSNADPTSPWQLLMALDRGSAMGVIGAVLGAVSGAIDWLLKERKARKQAAKPPLV